MSKKLMLCNSVFYAICCKVLKMNEMSQHFRYRKKTLKMKKLFFFFKKVELLYILSNAVIFSIW